mgnify:CR=1 FL=1
MLSVKISSVKPFSKCWFHGIKSGDELLSVDGKEVTDILDYDLFELPARGFEFQNRLR